MKRRGKASGPAAAPLPPGPGGSAAGAGAGPVSPAWCWCPRGAKDGSGLGVPGSGSAVGGRGGHPGTAKGRSRAGRPAVGHWAPVNNPPRRCRRAPAMAAVVARRGAQSRREAARREGHFPCSGG